VLRRIRSAFVVPVKLRLIGPPTALRSTPVRRIAARSSRLVAGASSSTA
jgi:hypothetical protein